MKKNRNRKVVALITICLLSILAFASSGSLAQSTSNANISTSGTLQYPPPTPTPTPPPTPTEYDYIMSISGSNYQILNGNTRTLIYQSTSSSTAFNYLLGSSGIASVGSTLYIEDAGTYTLTSTWHIYVDDVTITCEDGVYLWSTARSTPSDINNIMIFLHGDGITWIGGEIDGNGINQQPSPTTLITGANFYDGFDCDGAYCLIKDATVHDCRCYGILSANGATADHFGVVHCTVYNCGANGISASCGTATGTNNYFTHNTVYNCGDVGIDSYGYDTIITDNTIYNCGINFPPFYGYVNPGGWGIGIEMAGGSGGGTYLFIANNTISECLDGIVVGGSGNFNYVLISGNHIVNGPISGDWVGIWLYGGSSGVHNDIIEYNTVAGYAWGIYLLG
jgi:hypothetical protein